MAGPGTARDAELTLPPVAASASRARAFVRETLDAWGLDGYDDVLLLASELVTNALLHARTPMVVRLADGGPDAVLLSVTDGNATPPRGRRFSLDSGTGRGLHLLDSLADDWGTETRADGKTVWCRVRLGGLLSFAEFDLDAVEAL